MTPEVEYDEEGMIGKDFDQIRVYDAPMVALTQMFSNQSSWKSIKDTFLNPDKLSPAERDSFTGRLKRSLGDNPLTNSVIDVALNPFVWFLFLTTPAGSQALKSGGKVFTGLGKKAIDSEGAEFIKYAIGRYSPLQTIGLLNAHQIGAGTPLTSVLSSITSRANQLTKIDTQTIQPVVTEQLAAISRKFGVAVESFDPNRAPHAMALIQGQEMTLKEYLHKFNAYADIQMRGLHKDVVRKVGTIAPPRTVEIRVGSKKHYISVNPEDGTKIDDLIHNKDTISLDITNAIKEGKDPQGLIRVLEKYEKTEKSILQDLMAKSNIDAGDLTPELVKVSRVSGKSKLDRTATGDDPLELFTKSETVEALDPSNISGQWIDREGFRSLLDASREQMNRRYVDMFGDVKKYAETGVLEFDRNKIKRIFSSLSKSQNSVEFSDILSRELVGYIDPNDFEIILKGIKDNKLSEDKLTDLLIGLRGLDDLDNYMPRNVYTMATNSPGAGVSKRSMDSAVLPRNIKRDASRMSGRVYERNLKDPVIDSDDLMVLSDDYERLVGDQLARQKLRDKVNNARRFEESVPLTAENGRAMVMNLDFWNSYQKYLKSTRNDLVLHIDEIDDQIRNAFKGDLGRSIGQYVRAGASKTDPDRVSLKGFSNRYEAIEYITRGLRNVDDMGLRAEKGAAKGADYVHDILIERIRGNLPLNDAISQYATLQAKEMSGRMANSSFMKAVERSNETAGKFVKNLRKFATDDLTESGASAAGRGLTQLFYASHLGLNLGSAALNLMQPLLYTASWIDPKSLAGAYGRAIKQYYGYIQERIPMGIRPDPLQVEALRKKHFRLSSIATKDRPDGVDLLDILQTDFELIDQQAFAAASGQKKMGGASFWATEMPLKLFSHTELFNRLVTGEAIVGQSIKAGRLKGIGDYSRGVHRAIASSDEDIINFTENVNQTVQNTQFGSNLINSPQAFQDSFLGISWVRQFFTFPVRTLTAWTDTAPMINQGRRTWGLTGFETQGRASAMMHDLMRMMGTSAVVYEVGKNALDIDLSRGLAGQTLYESTIIGPALIEDQRNLAYNLPMSPAVDIFFDATNALTDEDKSILGTLAPRFIPGGIAMSRFFKSLPALPLTGKGQPFRGIQQQSADWTAMNEQGQIPIYRQDGSLLEYRSAARTVLGGLGFDSYMFKEDQALNKFLISNRQEIINERRKYMDAVLNNDMGKASKVKANFEKRFKFPLSVSKAQVDSAIQMREVPLKERMYNRITPDFRAKVRPYLIDRLDTLKSRSAEELDLSTAQKARVLPSTFDRDNETLDMLRGQ